MEALKQIIEQSFGLRPEHFPPEVQNSVDEVIKLLQQGKLRVAEKIDGEWVTHEWIKKAVLLSFQLYPNKMVRAGDLSFFDKVPSRFDHFSEADWKESGIRCVPTAVARHGSYIAPSVVLMPSFVNIGAYIGENTVIGDNTLVYPHTYVGDNVKIGSNCLLYSNVTIYHDCHIGNECVLHSGAVIGADGFGFAPTPQGYEKIPQIGIVILEDRVDIGANTCVDRATMGATIVHSGVKLDNLVQVAHNDEIGSHTVMAAQVGIAGSTKIGEWCMFGGQVGIAGHIKIGDKVNLGAQSGVPGSIKSESQLIGTPPMEPKQYFKAAVVHKNLPELQQELRNLRKELEELKQQLINK